MREVRQILSERTRRRSYVLYGRRLRTFCPALSTALGALGELGLETLELRHDLRPCSPSSRRWSVSHFRTRLEFVVKVVEVRRASVRCDALTECHVHGHLTTAPTGVR